MLQKMIVAALILSLICCLIFCTKAPTGPENKPQIELPPLEKSVVQADNKFGIKLFRKLVETHGNVNLFVSPLSVSMALGMTWNGANGTTREAMQNTLELQGMSTDDVNQSYKNIMSFLAGLDTKIQFQIANSIWYREGFAIEKPFVEINQKYFNAAVQGLNFSLPNAAAVMNNWIANNTNGRIENMIESPIDPAVVMYLINAIFFKGTWKYQFKPELTRDDYFYPTTVSPTKCKMMHQKSLVYYYDADDFQAVDLPYGNGAFTMTVFLPHLDKNLDNLISALNPDTWQQWMKNMKQDSVSIFFPKFKLIYEKELKDALISLGMGEAFSGAADFTKIRTSGGLFISRVKHKSFIEVNEEGTEAAAATVVEMKETAGPGKKENTIYVNRPFMFVLREKNSGIILFAGKIINPGIN